MFRSTSLFIGTSFTVAVFTIFATSNVDSIVGIPHKIYSMQRILIHIISRSLCLMCPSAPRVCSEPGGQEPVLSLSLDLIRYNLLSNSVVFITSVLLSGPLDNVKNCLIVSSHYQYSSQRSHLSFVNLPELKIISSKRVPWSFCELWNVS